MKATKGRKRRGAAAKKATARKSKGKVSKSSRARRKAARRSPPRAKRAPARKAKTKTKASKKTAKKTTKKTVRKTVKKTAKKSAKKAVAKKAVKETPVTPATAPAAAKAPAPKAAVRKPAAPKPPAKPKARPAAVTAAGAEVLGRMGERYAEILSAGALGFLADLHHRFDRRRRDLLTARAERQVRFDAGELPDFLRNTEHIRSDAAWRVAPIPPDLKDRRVEITGPVDRKMIVNALNSGATHYMADFEDANSPTWSNNIEGQINLKDLWAGEIDFTDPSSGKRYAVGDNPAVLIVRPRGWHLTEAHLTVGGEEMSGGLFDFGLYFFHNVQALKARGTGPYFYLPKLESHLEARLWNDAFTFAEERLGVPVGTIKATVLVETLPAAFEMEEILWELRDHIAGMNAGRWDYIFSFIKTFAKNSDYVLPDRSQVVMGKAFLGAYAELLVRTCHRRGAHAMGGMAAQIPIKNNPDANNAALDKVRLDKEREVNEGFDGTWVAHPDLVPVAKEVFDRLMPQANQVERVPEVRVTRDDLLRIHEGTKTEAGFRLNIRVGVQYIEAWLRGRGAVPIYNLMEDAATAEISRAQIWQWLKYDAELEGGIKATRAFFLKALDEEMEVVKEEIGAANYARGRFPEAIALFRDLSMADAFEPFLTLPAYELIK